MRSRLLAVTMRVETKDGRILRLTDWAEPIEIHGKIYYPSAETSNPPGRVSINGATGGIQFTQFRTQGAMAENTTEVESFSHADIFTAQEIDSRDLDLADVHVSSVDPRFPWVELPGGRLYVIERLTRDTDAGISFDLVSKSARAVSQRKGEVVGRNCSAEWGDARCFRPHEAGGDPPLREDEWTVGECEITQANNEGGVTVSLPSFSNSTWELSPTDVLTGITVGNPTTFTTQNALPYFVGDTFQTQVFGFGGITPEIRGKTWTATVTGTNTFTIDSGITTSGTASGLGSSAMYYVNTRSRVTFSSIHPWGGLVGRFLSVPLTVSGAALNSNVNGTYRAGTVFVPAGNALEVPALAVSVTPVGGFTFVDVDAGWFTNGLMTVTDATSPRDGRVYTIAQPDPPTAGPNPAVDLEIELPLERRFTIGETVSLRVGCTKKLEEDCALKFGNQINFRGRGPFALEATRMIQTPRSV